MTNLESKWVLQNQVFGAWQSNPLVVDGMMYVTQRPNDVMALDAKTGRVFWLYRYTPSPDARVCCGANNRGVAILGDTLFMGTLDAHLIALDAKNGRPLWNIDGRRRRSWPTRSRWRRSSSRTRSSSASAAASSASAASSPPTTRRPARKRGASTRFPAPASRGTTPGSGDDVEVRRRRRCGSPAPTIPTLNLTYWGIGNPGPDWNPDQRPGDNLYSDSVVALDADTGKLKWHFQFTPNDGYDYDSVQVPVLADIELAGQARAR